MATVARRSRNDLFSTDFSILPPSPTPPASRPPIPVQAPVAPVIPPLASSPSFTTSSASLQLRLSKSQLGNGRHASVYLGSYRSSTSNEGGAAWTLCAAKRLSADKEAQLAGLNEALMLSKLARCPQIIRFIGLKDEREESTNAGTPAVSPRILRNGTLAVARPAMRERSPSASGSLSVPSSPVAPSDSHQRVFPPFLGEYEDQESHQMNRGESSLRRASTVKANKTPSNLGTNRRDSFSRDSRATEVPRLVLLTEYCQLGNLANFVDEHGTSHLGQRMFFKLATDLLRAIVACHEKNIIHGDVKPQNCMIDSSFDLKLGDFSSSVFNSPNLIDGIALGTTQYSPPELIKPPPSPFSFPVDVFAAGLVLLYMLTGVEPYESLVAPSRCVSRSVSMSKKGGSLHAATAAMKKKRARTSSGAGKMVEMHLHLSKGNAWEWEERRRLDEQEEEACRDAETDGFGQYSSHQRSNEDTSPTMSLPAADTEGLLDSDGSAPPTPCEVRIPLVLQDPEVDSPPIASYRTYADGYTPVQTFLASKRIVSLEIRTLLQRMLSPAAENRPTASEALRRLQVIETEA